MKNIWLKIAGFLNLVTACLHLIGGQLDLVNPMLSSSMSSQQQAEWLGVWHMVTVMLFASTWWLLRKAFSKQEIRFTTGLKKVAALYVLFGLSFVFASLWVGQLAPQWILLIPIGLLIYLGARRGTADEMSN